jgi:DNA-binding MarR family transcriptional regulator
MPDSLHPEHSPGLLLWRTTLRWQREIRRALKPLGLTHVQFVLLTSTWWLDHEAGTPPTQRDLAEHAAIDPMMTSQVLRAVEARGFITRERDAMDSRAFRIRITDAGAELARRAVTIVERTDAAFFAAAPDQAALETALTALAASPPAPPRPRA